MANKKRPLRASRVVLIAAVMLCVLALAASAAIISAPVLRKYFSGAGYDQSASPIGSSQTKNGWTLTLSDCVGDDYCVFLGLELTAPEGMALNSGEYHFEDFFVSFQGIDRLAGAAMSCEILPDDDSRDNRFDIGVWYYSSHGDRPPLNGRTMDLRLGRLYHNAYFAPEKSVWVREYDCADVWSFQADVSYPDNAICLEPGVGVTTLGVEARLTHVEVSPLGVYVLIEGDALKGHHIWTESRYGENGAYDECTDSQTVTLYKTDGEAIELFPSAPCGCSGGYDVSEPGILKLARRPYKAYEPGMLLDMDSLERIEICGVSIPLK